MTSLLRLANRIRQVAHLNDPAIALQVVEEAAQSAAAQEHARHDLAARAMRQRQTSRAPLVCIGASVSSEGRPYDVLLTEREVRAGGHWLVAGATGAGKSFLILALLTQLLRFRSSGICIIDPKGELAKLVREVALPALVSSLPEAQATQVMRNIAVIAPFDEGATPPFQLLTREASLPIEVQAHEVATSFGRTIGSDLGALQQHALLKTLMLAIDVGLTIPDVPELLRDADFRRGALERTSLPDVKSYFANQFSRERGASLAGLLSRLDSIVMHPSLRRMLRAPGMARFDLLLERAITIIDLGGAPAGMGELTRFFGQLVFGKIVRAVFRRNVTDATLPVTIIADEFQQLLMPELARDMERVLTLARSQRVFLWAMFQQAAQIDSVSPTLLRILRTNTNYQVLMRSDIEDARALSHVLPVTGQSRREATGFPDPRATEATMTVDEERRRLIERVPSMPDRIFWFWDRRAQHPAILTRSPTLNLPAMRRQAVRLPQELRTIVSNGVLAIQPEELQRAEAERVARREELSNATQSRAFALPQATESTAPEPLETDEPRAAPSAAVEPSELPPRRSRNRLGLG